MELNIVNNVDGVVEEELDVAQWPEESLVPEGAGESPLFELKLRRDRIAKELVRSFQVPRWEDPEVFCEFTLIEPSVLAKAIQKREKQKNRPDDWIAWAYSDVLSMACNKVYATLNGDDSVEYSLRVGDANGTPTKVDHDLAEALGLDPSASNASSTFRKLFFSEGDLIEFANKVFKWSSIVNEEADENF